jgi:hypothetical protein
MALFTNKKVTDESGPSTGDDTGADFLTGYAASSPDSADAPHNPSWQDYGAPGEAATAYKAFWKTKPRVFPNGAGDDGTA